MRKLLAVGLLLVVAGSAHAGIIIKKNGNVFVGRIDPDGVKTKTITMHSPRLTPMDAPASGDMTFDRDSVRWFDADADEPTDAYWKDFLDAPLDPHWTKLREQYIERTKTELPIPTTVFHSRLAATALERTFGACRLSIRKPVAWSVSVEPNLTILRSEDGHAWIHVFASDLSGEHALSVAHEALRRLGTRFESETATGNAREWLTLVERRSRTLQALRRIVQTESYTAFAVGYADERDWSAAKGLVGESLATFQALER